MVKYCCDRLKISGIVAYDLLDYRGKWALQDNSQYHQENEEINFCPFCGVKLK
jgi:hypothetical protein